MSTIHHPRQRPPRSLADRPEHSPQSPLSVHDVTVAYGGRPVLWDVDYDAPDESLIAIVGPNGAGKSTLIKACLGLVRKASGRVEFWGRSYQQQRRLVGYVPQRSAVDWDFPVSALDVVLMGRYRAIGWCRPVTGKHRRAALACLDQVGMADYAGRQISQLSGGQQQRVFLARALAQEAQLYFMDEPLAGVDAATEQAIIDVLRELRRNGCTVICVHHDVQTVRTYFDHVVLLNARILAAGPIDEAFTEENLQRTYGGRLTLLEEAAAAVAPGAVAMIDSGVTWDDAAHILTLRAGYNTLVVTIGTTLLGAAAGVCGTFALLRRRALVGDAVAHATLPGIAGAFVLATMMGTERKSLPILLAGAAVSGVLGLLAVQALTRWTRLRDDAAIAVVLSVFFGAGIVLLSYIQGMSTGTQAGLHHFIYGQTVNLRLGDAMTMGVLALVTTIVAILLFKEFRLVAFDEEFAAVQGWPVTALDLAMLAMVILVTIIGLQAVGLLLVIALLIIPAAAARFWTDRLVVMTILAGVFGAISGYLGSTCSALFDDVPAGGVIVLVAGAVFLVSLVIAPARGVLASAIRHARLSIAVMRDHILRAMYEAIERHDIVPEAGAHVDSHDLRRIGRSFVAFPIVMRWMRGRGLLERVDDGIRLTQRGLEEALAVTRKHRLWEEYLVTYAQLAPTHVDRSADLLEHAVSPDIVRQLEATLADRGDWPGATRIPPSVHEIEGGAR